MKMQGCQQAKHLVWHQPTGVQCQATRLSVTRAAEAPTSGLSSQEHKTTQQAQATDATVASAAQVLDMAVGHQCPPLLRPQLCKERAAQPTWRMGNAAAGHCCLGFSQLGLKRSDTVLRLLQLLLQSGILGLNLCQPGLQLSCGLQQCTHLQQKNVLLSHQTRRFAQQSVAWGSTIRALKKGLQKG